MIVIGIDPGLSGGIAILQPGAFPEAFPMPTVSEGKKRGLDLQRLRGLLLGASMYAIEKAQPMPKQGVTSCFNYGKVYGVLMAMSWMNGSVIEVRPQEWQREFGITRASGGKERAISVAMKLFPGTSLLATERCRKAHDGMADALLIAEWCRRKVGTHGTG